MLAKRNQEYNHGQPRGSLGTVRVRGARDVGRLTIAEEVDMRIALVGPETEENLSLRYIAAALDVAGQQWRIVPFARRKEIRRVARAICRMKPDVVALSLVFQTRVHEFFDLVTRLRSGGYSGHITAGGHFASLRAREILRDASGIDTILHHEGERRLVQLAKLLQAGRSLPGEMDGITWRDESGALEHRAPRHVANLDDLPYPARRTPSREMGIPMAPLVTSRGCAGDCAFCSIRAWHRQVRGARLRLRSPASVAEEMAALYREHGVRIFNFHDDDFLLPRADRALERCREILDRAADAIGEPFSFALKCRPDDVEEGLFAYLKEMGLDRAYVGIETHSDGGLRTLNRRVTKQQNLQALDILDRLGIYSCSNLLLFDPDTTIEGFRENLDFLAHQRGRAFDIARTELYAGAALEVRMIREDRAIGDYKGWDYRIADPCVERIFRLFVEVMWTRHFGDHPIVPGVQDLGHRLALVRRFRPEAASIDMEKRVDALLRGVNEETLERLRTLARYVAEDAVEADAGARARFARRQKGVASRVLGEHRRRLSALRYELELRWRLSGILGPAVSPASGTSHLIRRVATCAPLTGMSLLLSACGLGQTHGHGDPAPPPHVSTYEMHIEPSFVPLCTTAGCHDAATASSGLRLDRGQGYANLVGVDSLQLPTMERVDAGASGASYLWHKLEGSHLTVGGSGERMPRGQPEEPRVADDVAKWIDEGAQ